jgi:hypothetical protein
MGPVSAVLESLDKVLLAVPVAATAPSAAVAAVRGRMDLLLAVEMAHYPI